MDPNVTAFVGGVLGGLIVQGARWVARRTKTKKDDRIVERAATWLEENPQAVALLADLINRIRK